MKMKNVKDVHQRIREILTSTQDRPTHCSKASVINAILSDVGTISKGRKKTISYLKVAQYLSKASSPDINYLPIIRRIQSVHETYLGYIKAVERNSSKIEHFLQEGFEIPSTATVTVTHHVPPPSQSATHPESPSSPPTVTQTTPDKKHADIHTPVKTRRDCDNCSTSKKASLSLLKTLKNEKKKKRFELKSLAAVKRNLNVKYKNQKLSRKENKISELKQTVRTGQIRLKCAERKNQKLSSLTTDLQKKTLGMQIQIDTLKTKLMKAEQESINHETHCDSLERRIKELEEEIEKWTQPIVSKSKKAYDAKIRRLIYSQLVCDVPVKNCGYLLNEYSKVMCGQQLTHTPSPSTCAQMAYELGVLTTIQVVSFMLSQQKNICLSWDATSLDGCHINEVHLTVDRTQCLVLDVRHLPGGKTSDYVSHIVSTLSEAADVYARYMKKSSAEVFAALKSMITSTLTDRAAVNGAVTRQLCQQFDSQLIELNCNIHPLDSIARQSKVNLQKLDKRHDIQGSCYGSEGTAANLINAVSVLRFKDGSGDPAGFKNMLRHYNLPVGTFIRYVGNRIHVLFHLGGLLVLHWDKLNNFIEMQCTAGGLLRSRLLKDIRNEKIMAQVWALGILGKTFTGPWMSKFYSGHMSNLEMRPLVQSTERQLQMWQQMPQTLLQPTCNVFGEELSTDDDVLAALHNFIGEVDIQLEALSSVLEASLIILQRQLRQFLTDEELPLEIRSKVSSAPTHNMAAERTLGCLDKMFRRAPVATGGFLNGKVLSKLNKCTQWIDRQSPTDQEQLIHFAISEARQIRVKRGVLDKALDLEISQRRGVVAEERKGNSRKKAVKSLKKALKTKSVSELQCSETLKERIKDYIEDPDCLVGIAFIHSVDHSELYGRIHCVERDEIVVGYWGFGETESSSVDRTLSCVDFFADAILDSVVFL